MVASVSVNDLNSTVRNTRFWSTRFVMYIQSHTWFPSTFNCHLLVWLTWPLCPIGKELEGLALNPQVDKGRTYHLEPGPSLTKHLLTAPGLPPAVPHAGWPLLAQPPLSPCPPHFRSTPPRSCFSVEFGTIAMFDHSIPQRWAIEHCCPSLVQCDCGILQSTPANPSRFFLLGLWVGVVAWWCGVLVVGQVPRLDWH